VESVLPYFAAKIAVSAQTSDYVVWGTLPLSGYGYGYGYGDGSGHGQ